VISLGELQLIERFLDTEISFFHYLTRRATIEEIMDFDGDEQDLLSMYLTNGFYLDKAAVADKKVFFTDADSTVRKPKAPRLNRKEAYVHGPKLSPMWRDIVGEIYRDSSQRHRFDIIQTVLNQSPLALVDLERRIRRWKGGECIGRHDTAFIHDKIGAQQFVVVVHFAKKISGFDDWKSRSREMAFHLAGTIGATECAVFLQLRKSRNRTYDAVSFFRMGKREARSAD
jgi:hypothetical protein